MTISQINQVLIQELPKALNSKFEDYYLSLKEMIYGEEEEIKEIPEDKEEEQTALCAKISENSSEVMKRIRDSEVLSLNLTLDSFLSTLPDDWIEINELVDMYNKYFNSNVNSRGFSKIKGIKDSFEKKSNIKKNKKLTLYRVLA